MSPVPANVQPALTISSSTNEPFGLRGNITPIMSTPQAHANNVRIDSLQPPQNSANSPDSTRAHPQLFGPPPQTVPSNGFAPAHIPAASQPQAPSSSVTVPGTIPVTVTVTAGGGLSSGPGAQQPSALSSTSAAPSPAPLVTTTSTSSLAIAAPATRSDTPTAGGRRSRPSGAASRSRTNRQQLQDVSGGGATASQTQARAQAQAEPQVQAQDLNDSQLAGPSRTNNTGSPREAPLTVTLANFAPPQDALPSSVAATPTLPPLNSSLMAPSPAPQNGNNGTAIAASTQMHPPAEGIYRTFEELLRAVQQSAKAQGYSVVKLRSSNYRDGKATRYDLVCDRGGVKYNSTAKKRNPSTRKVDCPWRGKAVCEVQLNNQWRFQVQDARHNHEPRIQTAVAGVEQAPTSQYLRTISNKIDRVGHDLTQMLSRIDNRLEGMEKRLLDIETRVGSVDARVNAIESQSRMDIPMDDVGRDLLASSAIM